MRPSGPPVECALRRRRAALSFLRPISAGPGHADPAICLERAQELAHAPGEQHKRNDACEHERGVMFQGRSGSPHKQVIGIACQGLKLSDELPLAANLRSSLAI